MVRNTKIRACTETAELIHVRHCCVQKPLMIKKSFSKCPPLAWLYLKINCNLPIEQMNLHICYGKLRAYTLPFTSALIIHRRGETQRSFDALTNAKQEDGKSRSRLPGKQ